MPIVEWRGIKVIALEQNASMERKFCADDSMSAAVFCTAAGAGTSSADKGRSVVQIKVQVENFANTKKGAILKAQQTDDKKLLDATTGYNTICTVLGE